MKISKTEALRRRRNFENYLKLRSKKSIETVKKISEHKETVILDRNDFTEAWEYIEKKFPSISSRIRDTKIYKNENTYFCKKIGIPPGVGGIFFIKASSILICYSKNIPDDVVIVHEMLHYVSQLIGSRFRNEDKEEDFAYINSLPYIVKRYDEEWIIDKYLMPYYKNREYTKKIESKSVNLRRKVLKRKDIKDIFSKTYEKCKSLVRKALYDKEEDEGPEEEEYNRFRPI